MGGRCRAHFVFKGDGFCDDANNNCACNWDGGDCCAIHDFNVGRAHQHCTFCNCLDPDFQASATKNKPKGCWVDKFKGDKNCDDLNNFAVCDWDGGDCCGEGNDYKFCSLCRCKDPQEQDARDCSGKCGESAWMGDKFCDAENNNCGCNWDDGDCCDTGTSLLHCQQDGGEQCQCLDPNAQRQGDCNQYCRILGFVGDGNCDDANNFCGCDWDGGDCCGPKKTYTYCTACTCADPSKTKYYRGVKGQESSNGRV